MPAIIGALVAMLFQALRQYLPGILGRVLIAFGLTMAVNEVGLPALRSFVQGYMGGLPSVLLAYAGAIKFDVAITMILSTVVAVRAQRVVLSRMKQN